MISINKVVDDKKNNYILDNFTFGSDFMMNIEEMLENSDETSFEFLNCSLNCQRVRIELKDIRDTLHNKGYKTKLKTYLSKSAKHTTALDNDDIKYELIIYKK